MSRHHRLGQEKAATQEVQGMSHQDNDLERARAGDREAFGTLVGPYRAELQVHCYRMLGSLEDAEDLLQETLLAAWMGLEGFEGRSSVRTWLYRIATNRCLNHLRAVKRRPQAAAPSAAPAPSSEGEVPWLQPFPDVLLAGLPDDQPGPEARYESREAITLAFITAMQRLPPRPRAVLILRDVLGYPAGTAAELMSMSVDGVNNALKRARATLGDRGTATRDQLVTSSSDEAELLRRFVDAFVAFDVDAIVGLMSDDVWVRMPPASFEYHGREAARRFFSAVAARRRPTALLVPTRANTHPAWGDYRSDPITGLLHLTGIEVIAISGGLITELTRFEGTVAPWFGLPRTLKP
jgi:RNA polymerase sigma-70 factor (TIGR02960 family)